MFVGRDQEIDRLEELHSKKGSCISVIYGRRRIGKSSLISEFSQKKKCLKFEGLEGEHTDKQIENFKNDLAKQVNDKFLDKMKFLNWSEVFEYLTDYIDKCSKKIILVFDEFQWMSANQTRLVSLLKKIWDNDWKKSQKVHLVLCGSVASFMIQKVIKSSALFGRIDYQLCLGELEPIDIKKLLKAKRCDEEIFKYMLIFGGVPRYFELINTSKTFSRNIEEIFFKDDSVLLYEYEKIFYSQFREHRNYEKIIKFLQVGPKTLKEVSEHLKMESSGGVKSYLENLEKALFITAYVPYNKDENSKLKKYKLTDEYLRFYWKFVSPKKKNIKSMKGRQNIFQNQVGPTWDKWLGFAFENFCLKNAYLLAEIMGFSEKVKSFGPLFSKGDKGFQIDLLYERTDNTITLCEMKYYNKKVPLIIQREVEKKVKLLNVKKGITVEKAIISQYGAEAKLKELDYFHHDVTVADIMNCKL